MSTIASLLVRLGVDAGDVEKGMTKAEKFIDQHGQALQNTAAGIGLAAGAALGAGLAQALDTGAAMSKLAAQIGPGSQAAGDLGKVAGELYAAGFGDSMDDVASALKGVWQNGLIDEDAATSDIYAVGARAINTAKIMEEEYGRVTKAVGKMIKTGLVADAGEGFDLLVRGTQQGVNASEDLLDTFNEYGVQFQKLGLDGPKALGLLSQAIKGGARDSDVAADALKEFSIRAVDGTKASAEGYKLLGLSAEGMTAQIAKGGTSASAGLATVLDKLKGIKDPVLQSQAAVALFGTQAEDLGSALLAMDPATAVAGLGQIAGAADKAGEALNDNAASKLETFKRGLISTFVDVAGNQVIPKLERLGDWIERNGTLVKSVTLALLAFAVVFGTVKAGIIAYNAVMLVWRAMTVAATAAQWLWNIAMSLNPLGLIIIAVIAVIAIIVLLWMKCEGFRKIVLGLWSGVKAAFVGIGNAAMWLWNNAIKPAWNAIANAAMWLWNNAIKPAVTGIGIAWNWLSGVVSGAWAIWSNFAKSMFNLITWLYLQALKPVFTAIGWYIGFLVGMWLWLYNGAVKPVVDWIAAAAMWMWSNAIKPAWDGIVGGIQWLGAAFAWLYNNAIKPAIDGIAAAAMWLWSNGIKPAWDAIVNGARWLDSTFRAIFGAIGGYIASAFNGAVGTVKSAINSVIGLINGAIRYINGSVIDMANRVPGVSFGHIPSIPFLAKGGDIRTGGLAMVGERGPEVLNMPRGARVTPLTGGGGGDLYAEIVWVVDGQVLHRQNVKAAQLAKMRTGATGLT